MKHSNLAVTAIALSALYVLSGCLDETQGLVGNGLQAAGDGPQTSVVDSDLCQIDIDDCPGWPITVVRSWTLDNAEQVKAAQWPQVALSQTQPLCAGNSSSTWCGLTINFTGFRIETKCTAQGEPGDNEPITCQSRTCAGRDCGPWTSPSLVPIAGASSRPRSI